jgi:hypothetical protein
MFLILEIIIKVYILYIIIKILTLSDILVFSAKVAHESASGGLELSHFGSDFSPTKKVKNATSSDISPCGRTTDKTQ